MLSQEPQTSKKESSAATFPAVSGSCEQSLAHIYAGLKVDILTVLAILSTLSSQFVTQGPMVTIRSKGRTLADEYYFFLFLTYIWE